MKTQDFYENSQSQQTEDAGTEVPQNNQSGNENQPSGEAKEEKADAEKEQLKLKVDELTDKYLRQAAEFDNFKRRNAKERLELIQTAGKEVITDLLEVLDDSERAQKQLETAEDIQQIKEGIQLVFSKLKNILSSKGLKAMDAKGKEFNPDLHEAITEIDGGEEMKGKIIDEVIKGYYLNDKIIRYAKVVVGK